MEIEREKTRQRETKRDGDLGSAYRSGRVTCVPEVRVLAWTNRRATSLSLALFLCFSHTLPQPPTLSLLLVAARSPTRSFLRVYPRTRSARSSLQARTTHIVNMYMLYLPACLITSADNAMRPFRYNEMADDRGSHIADVEIGQSNNHAPRNAYIRIANLKTSLRTNT